MRYQTVVVGTDGSETALTAVQTAADLAAAMQVPLTVVVAYHPIPAREQAWITPGLGDTRFRVTGTEHAQEALDAAVAAARDAGTPAVAGQLVEGDAVGALLSVAESHSPALLVVGNRGMNRLSGRLLGSVPSDVAFRARCDILIVHTT
jgi:nucleotide-binding universal stress UspA family protein